MPLRRNGLLCEIQWDDFREAKGEPVSGKQKMAVDVVFKFLNDVGGRKARNSETFRGREVRENKILEYELPLHLAISTVKP